MTTNRSIISPLKIDAVAVPGTQSKGSSKGSSLEKLVFWKNMPESDFENLKVSGGDLKPRTPKAFLEAVSGNEDHQSPEGKD